MFFLIFSWPSGLSMRSRVGGARVRPGAMALTVVFLGASSSARPRVKVSSPPLAAL
jgi:hypothetical protein